MTRVAYAHQIQELQESIVAMASQVDKAIARSSDALARQDVDRARAVMEADREINRVRWQIEERALLMLATQAPIARDLRIISSVIHIATELERMADHAAGNAKIALLTAGEPLLKPLVDIPRMAEATRAMLSESITAFIGADAEAGRALFARDDEIDHLYNQIYRELLTYMLADPSTINRATHLLWAAHNLERIGDRVTNICERIVFMATGRLEELATLIV